VWHGKAKSGSERICYNRRVVSGGMTVKKVKTSGAVLKAITDDISFTINPKHVKVHDDAS
jgi:hypothetical protein